jgi:ABC-2 type transport system ATP-binding protein
MIYCEKLCKTYILRERPGLFQRGPIRQVEALREITLDIPKSQMVGLLGPNGAGKTTLLKILATLLLPTSGRVEVAGVDLLSYPHRARQFIGLILAGERNLYWKLTGLENLLLFAGLYNVPKGLAKKRAWELLRQVGLLEFANTTVEKYSTGMRKRLAIAKALIHEPKVLILDEPTSGLDVSGKREVWQALKDLQAATKVTMLLATHDMEEAETLPERLLLIHQGRIIADGAPAQIKAQAGNQNGNLADAFLTFTGKTWKEAEN